MQRKILLVDPDPEVARCFEAIKAKKDYVVCVAKDPQSAIEKLYIERFDILFCALVSPNDHAFFELAHHMKLSIVCFMDLVEVPQDILRQEGVYFLKRPISASSILEVFQKIVHPKGEIPERRIIAESPQMKKIMENVRQIAKSNASVLITGESGTGKEEIAQAIHLFSPRSKASFISVNCAAIAESLIETEFFGHEKGSFTGAIQNKQGRFELAHLGTLLLDEISEIPLSLQAKLLRVIQEQVFERVGGTKSIEVDVRLISTSNRDMQDAILQKNFREDLYYRLNVIPIHIPPLRKRQEDILPLTEHFLRKFCKENHIALKEMDPLAKQKLLEYGWPGNVRELANVIERSIILFQGDKVEEAHILLDTVQTKAVMPPCDLITLEEIEKKHILEMLIMKDNNRTQTAKALGISLRTLRNKLRTYKKS